MKKFLTLLFSAVFMAVSCGERPLDDTQKDGSKLTLESDRTEILADGTDVAVLTVKLDGEVVTEGVQFYDLSNVPVVVNGMNFKTKVVGEHSFYAIYNSIASDPIKINATEFASPSLPEDKDPSNTSFRKRVMLTQFTSTGCTFCPRVSSLLRDLAADEVYSDRFVLAASHADMQGYPNGDDPASWSDVNSLMRTFNILGYPTLLADLQGELSAYDLTVLKDLVDDFYGDGTASAGIAANSYVQDNALVVKAVVKAAKPASFRVGAVLLEDGIYGKQTSAPDESYNTHNNCVRLYDADDSFYGYSVGRLSAGETGEHLFVMKGLEAGWDLSKCKLLLYVSSPSGVNQVIDNAVVLPIGKSVGFEYR